MPRYYFSCEGAQTFVDQVGTELADIDTARLQAVENAAEIMRDNPASFARDGEWTMTVTEGGQVRILVTVRVEDVVRQGHRAE